MLTWLFRHAGYSDGQWNQSKIVIPVWVTSSNGHGEISIHFQKICEIVIALLKRNLISAWGVMWKSDFHMTPHAEIWFPHGQNFICCGLTSFLSFFYKFLLENTCTSKNLSNDSLKITKKNRKIAWLTLTGIQFPNGPWLSGMKISSSRGLKNPPKSARGKKYLPPAGLRPLGGKNFCPWANLRGFFNPGDEEISIPDNRPIRKLYIYHLIKLPFDVEVDEKS